MFKGGTTRRGTRGSSNSDDMTGDIDDMTIEGGMDDDHYDDEEDTEYQEVVSTCTCTYMYVHVFYIIMIHVHESHCG